MAENKFFSSPTVDVIESSTKIVGDIVSKADFRIDGVVEGNITTTGKVVVGKSGKISGKLNCSNADVSGSISDDSYVLFFVLNKNQKVESLVDYEYKVENYDKDKNLLSIYGLSSPNDAQSILEEIIKKNKALSNNKYFVISTPQYINVLVFKTLDKLKT